MNNVNEYNEAKLFCSMPKNEKVKLWDNLVKMTDGVRCYNCGLSIPKEMCLQCYCNATTGQSYTLKYNNNKWIWYDNSTKKPIEHVLNI